MNGSDPEARLRAAINTEQDAFRTAANVAEQSDYAKSARNLALSQGWFEALRDFVDAYRCARSLGHDEDAALGRLQGLAEHFSRGKIPEPVKMAVDPEGNSWWPGEQADISVAVMYVEAAKRGEISDTRFNKTVRDAYGVTAQTVSRWVRDRDRVCHGAAPVEASKLVEEIRKSGARYQEWRSGRKTSKVL